MLKQLSNQNTTKSKLQLIVFFLFLFSGTLFFEIIFKSSTHEPIILVIIFSVLYYLGVARFSTVFIDDKQVYFSGLFKKGIIPFNKLISVNTDFFSLNGIFRKSYPIVVRYQNDKGKNKKIIFLSREIGLLDEPEKIYALRKLREIIELHRNQ